MRLGARVLKAVNDQNNYEYANQFEVNEGSADTLYIQLVNLDHNSLGDPKGIPYHPASGATLQITLSSIDANNVAVKTALQPYGDTSIWSASILSTDKFGTGNIVMVLTEGGVQKRATIVNGVMVYPNDPSRC